MYVRYSGLFLTASMLCGLLLTGGQAAACTTCNPELQSAIAGDGFGQLFLYMFLPFALVAVLCYRLNKLK